MSVTEDQSVFQEESETPCDFTEFLSFATRLNIPLKEDYLSQLKAFRLTSGNNLSETLTLFEHGLKGRKYFTSDMSDERRIQNALWRVWWSQRRSRYHATQEDIPDQEAVLECPPEAKITLVRGDEISDVPTEYSIPALRVQELPVVGTYVHKHIIPGFAYRVRRNGSDNFLFDGQALVLEKIGQGYGKRLTFESEDLINNENFFWSDSNRDLGFAFSMKVVSESDKFVVFDSADRRVAEASVSSVRDEQEVQSTGIENGCIVCEVYVFDMECQVSFTTDEHVPHMFRGLTMGFILCGVASAKKPNNQVQASFVEVKTVLAPLGACFMLKCWKVLKISTSARHYHFQVIQKTLLGYC